MSAFLHCRVPLPVARQMDPPSPAGVPGGGVNASSVPPVHPPSSALPSSTAILSSRRASLDSSHTRELAQSSLRPSPLPQLPQFPGNGSGFGTRRVTCVSVSTSASSSSTSSLPTPSPEAKKEPKVDYSLNPRLAAVRSSKTVAQTDLARSMLEAGEPVISLAAGEPDFDTPAAISAAGIGAIEQGFTRYSPNAGTMQLRQRICRKLKEENNLRYAANEIVISNGAKQSVSQAILAMAGPGDDVLIPGPFWVSYPEMARLAGANPVIIPSTTKEKFLLTPEALKAALTPESRILILCSPSNPTGAVYTREEFSALADVIRDHPRLLVISDEIYEHIIYAPAQHHSFASFDDMWERTITINGFSKAFAMTGWRLGYLAAPKPIASACNRLQSQLTSGPSSIAQRAAIAALDLGLRGGKPVQKMVVAFQERRDYVVKRLTDIPGVKLAAPSGAFYVMPDVSSFFETDYDNFGVVKDSNDLTTYLLKVAKVALVPGEAFGAPECIRISYAASLDTLRDALDRIEAALLNKPAHLTPL